MSRQKMWTAIVVMAMVVVISLVGQVVSQDQPDRDRELRERELRERMQGQPGQQQQPGQQGQQDRGLESDEQLMEKMKKAMEPGEQHKALKFFAGTWNLQVTSFCPTGPEQTTGTSEVRQIFDGRFLFEHVRATVKMPDGLGNNADKRMEGICIIGFDNIKRQYTMTFLDNLSTTVFHACGTVVEKGVSGQQGMPGQQGMQDRQQPGQVPPGQAQPGQGQPGQPGQAQPGQAQPGQPGQPGQMQRPGQMQGDVGNLEGKVIDFYGTINDPMRSMIDVPVRYRIEVMEQNRFTVTLVDLSRGPDAKLMQINYTRGERADGQ